MLKYCVIMTLCVNYGFSQSENLESKTKFTNQTTPIISVAPEYVETIPTFEEQGFKSITTENNKTIYRKEVNGIIVEFKPEEK